MEKLNWFPEDDQPLARRTFLKLSGLLGLGVAAPWVFPAGAEAVKFDRKTHKVSTTRLAMGTFVSMTLIHSSRDQAEEAMGRLLDLPQPPTAVFAGNDTQAIGAMRAARSRGLAIPADLAVIGFDDTTAARHSVPPLTTMRYPDYRVAAEGARMLIRKILRPEIGLESIVLPAELVIRESCGVRSASRPGAKRPPGSRTRCATSPRPPN